jgi:hypothetical protein
MNDELQMTNDEWLKPQFANDFCEKQICATLSNNLSSSNIQAHFLLWGFTIFRRVYNA